MTIAEACSAPLHGRYEVPARDFAVAIQNLNELVEAEDHKVCEERLAALKDILAPDHEPSWWPTLCAALADLDGEPIGSSNYELGRIPTSITADVIADVPGIQIDSVSTSGGVPMSIDYGLVWADDTDVAMRAIAKCMETATATVRLAADNLRKQNDGTPSSGQSPADLEAQRE